jgi:hypothetical protein
MLKDYGAVMGRLEGYLISILRRNISILGSTHH